MIRRESLFICLVLTVSVAHAKRGEEPIPMVEFRSPAGATDGTLSPEPRFALAAANTTLLASFDFDVGSSCTAQGWTVVDMTAQIGEFWHVDDFVGANVNPGDSLEALAGVKSLWCGMRASAVGLTCDYAVLPGYGNGWDQLWLTKPCIPVTGPLDVSFLLEIDSEPGYDALHLEYKPDCDGDLTNWIYLDGGISRWDGRHEPFVAGGSYAVTGSAVRVRLRFVTDGAWSDQDGFFDSHAGPIVIDNLSVEGLSTETFEDEPIGATETTDWEAGIFPGFGASYMSLFRGWDLVQEDPCVKNLSCMWAAINGSTYTYACGGFPQQKAVPRGNGMGQYIHAEIWSPTIPLSGTGAVNVQFSVYRDLRNDAMVFYIWGVRSIAPDGCVGVWQHRGFVSYGPQKDWFVSVNPATDLIDSDAVAIQVSLGVRDMCGVWCGAYGRGCVSHAPLFDRVRVYRVDVYGPVWFTRDMQMFQDTFPTDGSDTGVGRADAAMSLTPPSSPTIAPADSVGFIVSDPVTAIEGTNPSGLADDVALGGKQVYLWVHVLDSGVPSVTKRGAILTDHANYPFKDTQPAFGKTWTRIRCFLRSIDTWFPPTVRFVVDLNDNLFEAGDVVEFFFSATNTNGQTSYCSGPSLTFVQSDLDIAAEVAAEFTVLPLNGGSSTDILYVDGMDGRGAQVFWDTAFENVGLIVDRYDVRAPSSSVSNRPASRVTNVANQLSANYKTILWDTGDLERTLGDGSGEKEDDYAMVNQFLAALSTTGGIYISGDDFPWRLNFATGVSAVTFRSAYITYTFTSNNHRPAYGVSPLGIGVAGGAFAGDTFVIHGGCPLINDFDVISPTGSSVKQIAYTAAGNNAAVISKVTGNARAMISGFSFVNIRDDEEDGIMDRAKHLHDILTFLGGSPSPPTDADAVTFANSLEQNYPNPFNPQTTIAFSLKQRGRVRIDVYDVTGALIHTLLDEVRPAGSHDVRWDGHDRNGRAVASGVYFYKLVTDGFEQTRKMVLLK